MPEYTYDNEIANITEVPSVETETSVSQTSEEAIAPSYETSADEKEESSSNTSSEENFEYTTVGQVTAVTTTAEVTTVYETSADKKEENSPNTSSEEYFEYTTSEQTTAVTTADEVELSLTEWKINILENYYNNELKTLTEYDSYEITGAKEPHIYDLTGNGDVILLCKLIVPIGALGGSVTIGCAVDDSGNVTTEKIVDNTGGGVIYEEYAIVKNSVNNKLYCKYYVHGLSQYNDTTYTAVDKTEEICFLMPGLGSEYEFIICLKQTFCTTAFTSTAIKI